MPAGEAPPGVSVSPHGRRIPPPVRRVELQVLAPPHVVEGRDHRGVERRGTVELRDPQQHRQHVAHEHHGHDAADLPRVGQHLRGPEHRREDRDVQGRLARRRDHRVRVRVQLLQQRPDAAEGQPGPRGVARPAGSVRPRQMTRNQKISPIPYDRIRTTGRIPATPGTNRTPIRAVCTRMNHSGQPSRQRPGRAAESQAPGGSAGAVGPGGVGTGETTSAGLAIFPSSSRAEPRRLPNMIGNNDPTEDWKAVEIAAETRSHAPLRVGTSGRVCRKVRCFKNFRIWTGSGCHGFVREPVRLTGGLGARVRGRTRGTHPPTSIKKSDSSSTVTDNSESSPQSTMFQELPEMDRQRVPRVRPRTRATHRGLWRTGSRTNPWHPSTYVDQKVGQ